jgi:hypothetical protein
MITRAVFSYYNAEESFSNKAGFAHFMDFLYTMALAVHLAGRHFESVQVVTSTWGARVLKKAGVTATEFDTRLDVMKTEKVSRWWWAYAKLLAYSYQTGPFVHIDNDVLLWQPLPQRILNARLCFQSKELMNQPFYMWYNLLKPCWRQAKVRPQIIVDDEVTDFVYNCGICGGHDLAFFKEWLQCSAKYIFAPENHDLFFNKFKNVLMHQNLFDEQYFAAALVKAHNLRGQVELITDDVTSPTWKLNNKTYSHIWGATKTNELIMNKVKARLHRDAPAIYDQVTAFANNYLFNECQKDIRVTTVA